MAQGVANNFGHIPPKVENYHGPRQVDPRNTESSNSMNVISESERVMESSVTWRIESEATEGIKQKRAASIMMPWKTRSRKMPVSVILMMFVIVYPPLSVIFNLCL